MVATKRASQVSAAQTAFTFVPQNAKILGRVVRGVKNRRGGFSLTGIRFIVQYTRVRRAAYRREAPGIPKLSACRSRLSRIELRESGCSLPREQPDFLYSRSLLSFTQVSAPNTSGVIVAQLDDDGRLLSRCLEREPGAWKEFVDRFAGLFANVIQHTAHARSIPLTPHDVDDLAADVFLALLANNSDVLRRFRGDSSLNTYLTVICRRIIVHEMIRRPSKIVETAEDE